ncbi:histidinol phosphatase-like enzyme [Salinibacter ruber]|uniref:HAD hydrolase-like protein n=1 Tax=Salinibacter ruber TaxID=146919 RepID=UPI002167CDDE|nr:HAD hydrolase-like protein [Salinibacter ruber]MCS3666415.1 histidinol phosphatase-like enzyme [Salinibacter ruber]
MASGSEEEYAYRSLRRKPRYGMLAVLEYEPQRQKGASYIIDWDESLMIGDRDEDMACAQAAGVTFYHAEDWHAEIKGKILEQPLPLQ